MEETYLHPQSRHLEANLRVWSSKVLLNDIHKHCKHPELINILHPLHFVAAKLLLQFKFFPLTRDCEVMSCGSSLKAWHSQRSTISSPTNPTVRLSSAFPQRVVSARSPPITKEEGSEIGNRPFQILQDAQRMS